MKTFLKLLGVHLPTITIVICATILMINKVEDGIFLVVPLMIYLIISFPFVLGILATSE